MSRLGFGLSILPVFLIGLYIYKKDRNKEPFKLLTKLFFGGLLSIIITLILTFILGLFFPFFLSEDYNAITLIPYVFIGVALVEEFSKWISTYFFSFHSKEFDETYDIIVYSVFVSLGFACFENLLYVATSSTSTALLRAITAVPAHAFNAVFMGYFLSLYKTSVINKTKNIGYLVFSLIAPVLLHGFYDYLIFVSNIFALLIFVVYVIGLYIASIIVVRKSSKKNDYIVKKYCTNCGQFIKDSFCTNCGHKYEE